MYDNKCDKELNCIYIKPSSVLGGGFCYINYRRFSRLSVCELLCRKMLYRTFSKHPICSHGRLNFMFDFFIAFISLTIEITSALYLGLFNCFFVFCIIQNNIRRSKLSLLYKRLNLSLVLSLG